MTEQEEDCSMLVIDFCRRHFRKLGEVEFAKRGARPDDISIAAIYAAVDLAQQHAGDTASAIRWARQALDVLEGSSGSEITVQ